MTDVSSFRSRPGAAFAAFLWLSGTVVLPALHLARHAWPHDHEGGGIHYHLEDGAGHDAHDDHDDHDDHDGDDEPGGPFTVEAPHHHGHSHRDEGLAHFAAATGDGAAAALAFSSELDPERVPDALASRYVQCLLEGRKAARAPPTA